MSPDVWVLWERIGVYRGVRARGHWEPGPLGSPVKMGGVLPRCLYPPASLLTPPTQAAEGTPCQGAGPGFVQEAAGEGREPGLRLEDCPLPLLHHTATPPFLYWL